MSRALQPSRPGLALHARTSYVRYPTDSHAKRTANSPSNIDTSLVRNAKYTSCVILSYWCQHPSSPMQRGCLTRRRSKSQIAFRLFAACRGLAQNPSACGRSVLRLASNKLATRRGSLGSDHFGLRLSKSDTSLARWARASRTPVRACLSRRSTFQTIDVGQTAVRPEKCLYFRHAGKAVP